MPKLLKNVRAQTAMELAVFGAILIFVVGAIVRQALSAGYMQNQQLRAMRQAMSTSYRYSTGLLGTGGNKGEASHQTASILFVEDRLTADSAKHGAIDRTPYMVSASASYSRNLFFPVDINNQEDLPIFDIFINGKHFPFTVSRFKWVELARNCAGDVLCPAECGGDCSATSARLYPAPSLPAGWWQSDCIPSADILCVDRCNPAFCNAAMGECGGESAKTWQGQIGCAKLYTVVYNHGSYVEWCTDEPGDPACPVVGNSINLTTDERFDLDHDGTTDVPAGSRKDFSWQWYLVSGYDATVDRPFNTLKYPESVIIQEAGECASDDCKESWHTSVDVDGDLKLEQIIAPYRAVNKDVDAATGVIRSFTVVDSQDGDLDFSRGDSDAGPAPGLTKNTKMFTRARDGTFLQIEEGKLYAAVKNPTCVGDCAGDADCIAACPGDGTQYIRTTQRKDQIDIVERTIQLSNDTHRFCDSGGTRVATRLNNDPPPAPVIWTVATPNPVEACNDCFSAANIDKTCMEQDPDLAPGIQPPVILVRSRVVDRHGRKWITNTSGDDYVDFTLPAGP